MEFKESNVKETKDGKKTVTVKCTDENAYVKECPLDKKQQNELIKYDEDYMGKVSDLLIKESVKKFNEDKKVDKVVVKAPHGFERGGYVAAVVDREKTFVNPRDKSEVKKSKVKFIVHHPSTSVTKKKVMEYEEQLTKQIC